MDSRTQNYINMIGTCLKVAQENTYKSVWDGQAPEDFSTDMATLNSGHAKILILAALREQATGGAGDAKAEAEGKLEDSAHLMARACYNHFKKSGDFERAGKLNYTKSDIVKLRTQELVNTTTAIRDLASHAVTMPDAAARGINPVRIAALTQAITNYSAVMHIPRGQIVNRSTLGKEIETDTAALLEHIRDMDDLVIQFGGTTEGDRFVAAWKRARIIVDSGSGHGKQDPPTP